MTDTPQPRVKLSKQDVIARDQAIRNRKFRSEGGEELNAARLRVNRRLGILYDLAASRGQKRGCGVSSKVPRKNCNIRRDAAVAKR